MKPFFKFLIARAQEPSSWRGLFMLLAGLGAAVEPTLAAQIIAAGAGLAGLIGVLTADPKSPAD